MENKLRDVINEKNEKIECLENLLSDLRKKMQVY